MVRFPTGRDIHISFKASRPALGVHPASYSMGSGALSFGVGRRECEADQPNLIPDVRMSGTIHPFSHMLHAVYGDKFTYTLCEFFALL